VKKTRVARGRTNVSVVVRRLFFPVVLIQGREEWIRRMADRRDWRALEVDERAELRDEEEEEEEEGPDPPADAEEEDEDDPPSEGAGAGAGAGTDVAGGFTGSGTTGGGSLGTVGRGMGTVGGGTVGTAIVVGTVGIGRGSASACPATSPSPASTTHAAAPLILLQLPWGRIGCARGRGFS
jgi:hypothetical protein